ncbi:MAG: tol-pal system protein YbgF, partial [Pseudomonadota bacterium]
VARLRGQLEVQGHQIVNLDRRQKELYGELDARLLKLQAIAKAQEKQAASMSDAALEAKAYEAALGKFNLGDYQSSVAAFQSFLVAFPNSQQAANAQYWIGNAYYALRDYKTAIAEQNKVVVAWPDSPKAPEALFNIASCQDNLNQTKAARETLQALMKKYPGTPAAEKAKQRLAGKR